MKKVIFFSALTALAAVGLSGCGSKPVIDFEECVSVTFTGYDNEGTGYIQTDNGYIFSMLGDMNSLSAAALVSTFTIDGIENNGELSNGDVITLTVNTDAEALKNAKVKVANTELEFVVTGLEQKPVLDVFSDLSLTVNGASPYCTVSVKSDNSEYALGSYSFDITSADGEEKEYYKNGETVTVTLTEDARQSIEQKYVLEEFSREYVVQADSQIIYSAADLGECSDKLKDIADDYINEKINSKDKASYITVLSDITGTNEGTIYARSWRMSIDNLNLNSAYIRETTETTSGYFATQEKQISYAYFFYDADLEYWLSDFFKNKEGTLTGVICVRVKTPTITPDGTISYDSITISSAEKDISGYQGTIDSSEKLF